MKLRVLDLFSGIGGFSLGLERTGGFETVAFCEIEAFPRKVLAKHWPDVPCYEDVRTLTAERLAADGIAVDVICGGFPCQDISFAGLGAGLAGERSGMFYEIARLIGELEPGYVILENVGALLSRGLDAVLGTLASLGYDAEWHCIPASAVGAPHRRDRVWIIAYAGSKQHQSAGNANRWTPSTGLPETTLATPKSERCGEARELCERPEEWASGSGEVLANATRELPHWSRERAKQDRSAELANGGEDVADANDIDAQRQFASFINPEEWSQQIIRSLGSCRNGGKWWATEPDVGRVANGVPDRSHRLKALGNAVVPQIPELIGNAILASMERAA